jgi:predicted nucleic acid-binding protein
MSRNAPAPIIIVSDTGPLLSALQCNRIDFLRRYFKPVYIPASAIEEFKRHNVSDNLRELIEDGLIVVEHLTVAEVEKAEQIAGRIAASPLSRERDYHHHLPEAEAMVLAQREVLGVSRILLEERAARQVARQMGIPLTGFIGVLLMACDEQLLTPVEMRALLEMCRQQGTRYSNVLVDEVCQLCKELRK